MDIRLPPLREDQKSGFHLATGRPSEPQPEPNPQFHPVLGFNHQENHG